mgnify:CR=1 FL=1
MKRGRKKKLAISLMDYMGKRRDMKRQLKKEGTAELYEVAVRHFLRFVKTRVLFGRFESCVGDRFHHVSSGKRISY